jgi:hypothetical protein
VLAQGFGVNRAVPADVFDRQNLSREMFIRSCDLFSSSGMIRQAVRVKTTGLAYQLSY